MDELAHLKSRAYWVRPGRLLAGGYPGSLVELNSREKIAWLLEKGVTSFLDLTQEGELKPYAECLPEFITYERMPIPDMGVPRTSEMLTILDAIDTALAAGKIVYVHCWAGRGRTGTVVGCYLVRHGMPGIAALNEIIRLRGGRRDSPEADEQYEYVRNWRERRERNDSDY